MPHTSDPDVGERSARTLLLIEDYDALVVAISSALRKFAPHHERHVVGSVSEAEKAADDYGPELVIIDLDPPQRGVVQLIERLRSAHPMARLLAFGCGTSREFAAARGSNAGIHFIEKPFELPEFGKLVQELTDATAGARQTVADIALVDLIALECIIGTHAVLRVEAAGQRSGEIHFADGQVTHATARGLVDLPAIEEMARWRKCRFAESDRPRDAAHTIHIPWSPLLVELLGRSAPDDVTESETASPPRRKKRKADGAATKRIVVVDDTELLLEFVEEILSAADPTLEINTAHTGTEGVRRAQLTRPDLVLLDYSLPDINGDEVCERLLAGDDTAQIPIVMMSGHLLEMAATAEQYENVVATIAKPFLSNDLVELVRTTLAKGRRKIAAKPRAPKPSQPPVHITETEVVHEDGGRIAKQTAEPPPPITAASPPPPSMPIAPPPVVPEAPPPVPQPSPPIEIAEPLPTAPVFVAPPRISREAPRTARPITLAPRISPISAPAPSVPVTNGRTVLLGIPLEALAVHLTPALKIGPIRARAASQTVSLSFPPETFQFILSLQTGFDIESVKLDEHHRLQAIWLVPNRRPIELLKTSGRFNVDDVEIAPPEGLDLLPSHATAMHVQMLAAFKMQSVELSPLFDVSRLVLSAVSHRVRVSLEASTQAPGSIFELGDVSTDARGNIGELLLSPV